MEAKLRSVVLLLVLALAGWLVPSPAGADIVSGTYTGSGASRPITGLGFKPDVVIIKGSDAAQVAVIRTKFMTGDTTKALSGTTGLFALGITSLDADGFTVGSDARVNGPTSPNRYDWIAFKEVPGELKVGTYTGNWKSGPCCNQPIGGVGFQPAYVITVPTSTHAVNQKSASMGVNAYTFDGGGSSSRIPSLDPDGFTVGTVAQTNNDGTLFHYVAWKQVAGKMKVSSYTNLPLTDNTSIGGAGFEPEYVIVKKLGTSAGVHHPASLGAATDLTLQFSALSYIANSIQQLQSDGFQIGTHDSVNNTNSTYYWMAFGFQCESLAKADYVAVAADKQSGKPTVYWSGPQPVLILRKPGAFVADEVPKNGTPYTVGNKIGAANTAEVVYNGSGPETRFAESAALGAGTYYYRVHPRRTSGGKPCYNNYTEVNITLPSDTQPAWTYMMEGGSILKAGIAAGGTIYTASNGKRIIPLNTTNGTQSWEPTATTAPVQGWLTWLPVGSGGGIKSVQYGTATMTTEVALEVPLTQVSLGRSILFFSVQGGTTSPSPSRVRGQLKTNADATDPCTGGASCIKFNRAQNGTTLTIKWYVAEFKGGVSVQRGTVGTALNTQAVNVPISPVNLAKSFVLVSVQAAAGTSLYGNDDFIRARLTSPSNLELSMGGVDNTPAGVDWQVVSMAGASVQSGDLSFATTDASKTVDLTLAPYSSVDPTKTFLLLTWNLGAPDVGGTAIGANFMRGRITSSNQLTFDRGTTATSRTINLTWFLVTLSDGSRVIGSPTSGNTSFGAGDTTLPATLNPSVVLNRSVAFLSGDQRGGSTPYLGDLDTNDDPSVAWFTADLGITSPSSNLQLTRATTGSATAEAAWFVVEFAQNVPTGAAVFGGDQGTGPDSATVYSADAVTGVPNWPPVTLAGADAIQSATAAQVRQWSNPATFGAPGRTCPADGEPWDDLIFVPTRNTSATTNKVFALRASDGKVCWTFNGTLAYQVDKINGMPYVDSDVNSTRDHLYVASLSNGNTQRSLWVIDTLTGNPVDCMTATTCNLGDLRTSPTLSYDRTTIYVGNVAGELIAIDAATLDYKWTGTHRMALGSEITGFVWQDYNDTSVVRLYFSTADGRVWCVRDPGLGAAPPSTPPDSPPAQADCPWKSAAGSVISGASTPLLMQKLFVGSSDGKVHQINRTTGVDEKRFCVDLTPRTVGDPSSDTGNEILVGTTEGRLYKIDLVSGELPTQVPACP